jgi:hypothetical protein
MDCFVVARTPAATVARYYKISAATTIAKSLLVRPEIPDRLNASLRRRCATGESAISTHARNTSVAVAHRPSASAPRLAPKPVVVPQVRECRRRLRKPCARSAYTPLCAARAILGSHGQRNRVNHRLASQPRVPITRPHLSRLDDSGVDQIGRPESATGLHRTLSWRI